jgi:hypothetical protein
VNLQRAAQIQVVLEGIDLPASRDELVRYAAREDRDAAAALERIEDRSYGRIDDVGEQLAPTAVALRSDSPLPKPESGKPPGGDDYLRPFPESGAVRPSAPRTNPPKKTIEQQTKTQKRQQRNQSQS